MKRIITIFVSLLMICGCALADESVLVVSGSGSVSMEAEQAGISLGVSLEGSDLTGLQQNVNDRVSAICKELIDAGLPEESISTNRIYINPVYNYDAVASFPAMSSSSNGSRISGYSIDNSLYIRTDEIDKLGEYIDAAFAAGANSFDSISFGLKDDRQANLKALELAVQNARRKAEVMAAAAGKELGEVIEIRESGTYSAVNTAEKAVMYDTVSASAAAGTTVRASQVEINASVEITYELK